ncbi:MAG: hypothetical protein SGJ18_07975 [Pseudomonadota bacterium]|nr:hypothetical protein [Pseudomonadota bacterium]
MKKLALISIILTLSQISLARAEKEYRGTLKCESTNNRYELAVSIEAKNFQVYLSEDDTESHLINVTMTAIESGDVRIGKKASLSNDKKYKPTKYKNHFRFDMSKLVNTDNFDDYLPFDYCHFSLMIPFSSWQERKFKAPLVFNCDQSGGAITLTCESEAAER